jgi:hypothetical protein
VVTDRLIRITTALAVLLVASVAAIISYQHACELVSSHGETGFTARLLPFTADGLIWAASMVALEASRRDHPVPRLALGSLGAGIVATVGANLAHGLGHGPVGALVSAWPALALVGSFELLMLLIRKHHQAEAGLVTGVAGDVAPGLAQPGPPVAQVVPTVEEVVRALHQAGHSQRSIARDLSLGRRKVKQFIDGTASPEEQGLSWVRGSMHTCLP